MGSYPSAAAAGALLCVRHSHWFDDVNSVASVRQLRGMLRKHGVRVVAQEYGPLPPTGLESPQSSSASSSSSSSSSWRPPQSSAAGGAGGDGGATNRSGSGGSGGGAGGGYYADDPDDPDDFSDWLFVVSVRHPQARMESHLRCVRCVRCASSFQQREERETQ